MLACRFLYLLGSNRNARLSCLSDPLPFGLQPHLADKLVNRSAIMCKTHLAFLTNKLVSYLLGDSLSFWTGISLGGMILGKTHLACLLYRLVFVPPVFGVPRGVFSKTPFGGSLPQGGVSMTKKPHKRNFKSHALQAERSMPL